MSTRLLLSLLALGAVAVSACSADDERFPLDPETGLKIASAPPLPELPDWSDNPATPEKDELGLVLFHDNRLSGSGTASCASCHLPRTDFMSGIRFDIPDRSFPGNSPVLTRNAPSLLNLVYMPVFRWDGSHGTDLYEVMALPFAEANMNLSQGIPAEEVETIEIPSAQIELKRRLTEVIPGYVPLFDEAFGVDIRALSPEEVWLYAGKAMAVYIRRAVSKNAPFDRWNTGEDDDALSDSALRGLELFTGKGLCSSCHSGAMFSDFEFHNIGSAEPSDDVLHRDEGRFLVTGKEEDRGKFLTPSLRTVRGTAPYLHDGRYVALAQVIKHKATLAAADPAHDPILDGFEALTDDEVADLVQFVLSLSGEPVPRELRTAPSSFPE